MRIPSGKAAEDKRLKDGLFLAQNPVKSLVGRGELCPRCGSRLKGGYELCLACGQTIWRRKLTWKKKRRASAS